MPERPVIFLSFANDQSAHLELLKEESRTVSRALHSLHDKQLIELAREESAQLEDIFHNFNRFGDRIAVFHYGGHAGGDHLHLEDQSANAIGLAKLLSSAKELQLVVLNGCSTQAQVEKLLALGVKAVIATSVAIMDNMALDFARQFYQSLAAHQSIREAFGKAEAFLQAKYEELPPIRVYRDFVFSESLDDQIFPWGVYLNKDAEKTLDWKIPRHIKVFLPPSISTSRDRIYNANQYLVKVLESMAEHEPELQILLNPKRIERNRRKFPGLIVEYFPWVIGAQIRRLIANVTPYNQAGLNRLRQIIFTYATAARFITYIVLSQIWDLLNDKKLKINATTLQPFLELDVKTYAGFDYLKLFSGLCEIFRENELEMFVPEFKAVSEKLDASLGGSQNTNPFVEAYAYLEAIRYRLNEEKIPEEEAARLCNECELGLTNFLNEIAFLVNYQLVTVKDIVVYNFKRIDPQFNHIIGELNVSHREYLEFDSREHKNYMDSHSILLAHKEEEEMASFLNLAPFIVDKNAFEDKFIPNVYMYAYKEKNVYHYLNVDHDINFPPSVEDSKLLVSSDIVKFQVFHQQFDLFLQDLSHG